MDAAMRALFDRLPDNVKRLARSAVRLVTTPVAQDSLRPGQNRIGGLPDVPPGFEWPRWKGLPMSFICQLDLAEVAQWPEVLPLPKHGSLLFFYDCEQRTWGFDPKDRGSWLVLYHPGDSSELATARTPKGLHSQSRFAAAALRPEVTTTAPHSRAPCASDLAKKERKEVGRFQEAMELHGGEQLHWLGGHALCIQGPMELECQLASNGQDCGDPSGYKGKRARKLRDGARDWRLLLQIGSDEAIGTIWGDAGIIYYWIREQDLVKMRFDRAWLILQCT